MGTDVELHKSGDLMTTKVRPSTALSCAGLLRGGGVTPFFQAAADGMTTHNASDPIVALATIAGTRLHLFV